ncbi:MAG: acetyl-CoA carboxylase biotin carboxylase subunit [Chloroflexi bacterium]|nr:acetyl-CoA carboxylase biotin carboxylase subunit [Chloroflexota bacterium]
MFKKVLVANRGEIAVRVMRACRELGIATVAVHSEADSHAFFAYYGDEAYSLGSAPAGESYLNIGKILDIARHSGADAIHPGYGFLAENAEFALACETAGIAFIGPRSESIAAMGDKLAARKLMLRVGVPVLPASRALTTDEEAISAAREIGYPVLIKAAAGGGGIGMRVVDSEADLRANLEAARSLSHAAFGATALFLEKYLLRPRHIEFQILGDAQGNYVYLGERDCSIQRRHQKMVEETPSTVMTDDQRTLMGAAAIKVAQAVDYVNAGTVEFLYDDGHFYFLEMNTRLQVEHTVTEVATGIDIVKEQILIASGESLSYGQRDIVPNGCAIECRICAEDPFADFAPAAGTLAHYRSPGGIGIRVDSGVHMGYTIPTWYDSMISKLVAWGRDRSEAMERMRRALFEYVIVGVTTNIPFLRAVFEDDDFRRGEYSTNFIADHPQLFQRARQIKSEERSLDISINHLRSSTGVPSTPPLVKDSHPAEVKVSPSLWRAFGRNELLNSSDLIRRS